MASVDGSRIRRKKKISESSNSVTFNNSKLSTTVGPPQASLSSSALARPRSYTLPANDNPACPVAASQRPAPYRALTRAVSKAPHEDLRSLYYQQRSRQKRRLPLSSVSNHENGCCGGGGGGGAEMPMRNRTNTFQL